MKCHVIRDLLPEYLEGLCSTETNRDIEEHLSGCQDCQSALDEMREENNQKVPKMEEIRPFQKIEREFKRNRLKKVVAVVLLVLVCAVFGTLSVGQMFPSLSCPSYDSLMYRFWAKEIAKDFANGDMDEILKASVENPTSLQSDMRERSLFLKDVKGHLKGYYEKSLKGKEVAVHVDGVAYETNDNWSSPYEDGLKPEGNYRVSLTLRADEKSVSMDIIFKSRTSYYLYLRPESLAGADGRFITDDVTVREGTDENSWEYNLSGMNSWLSYFQRTCLGDTWGTAVLNLWLSNCNYEMVNENWSVGRMSYYFTQDASQYGIRNKDSGCTPYSEKVDAGFQKIFSKCKESEFQMIDGEYNEEEHKFNATLFWKITDLDGHFYVMRKDFYYGLTGYQPADENEKVFSDTGADEGLVDSLKTVFD